MQRIFIRFVEGVAFLLVFALATAAAGLCTGDCNTDGAVAIDELLLGVNIALGNAPVLTTCAAMDANQSGSVEITEVIAAVNHALDGCPVCGDGRVDFDQGETCDDGNTVDGDACPASCRIRSCTATGTHLLADVQFSPPAGVDLAGITVFVRYPDGVVRIPGMANDASVQGSIMNLPDNGFPTLNDLDYALRVVLFTPDSSPIAPARLFTIQFDTCTGAALPQASDFLCSVESAADTNNDPVAGAACSVSLP